MDGLPSTMYVGMVMFSVTTKPGEALTQLLTVVVFFFSTDETDARRKEAIKSKVCVRPWWKKDSPAVSLLFLWLLGGFGHIP